MKVNEQKLGQIAKLRLRRWASEYESLVFHTHHILDKNWFFQCSQCGKLVTSLNEDELNENTQVVLHKIDQMEQDCIFHVLGCKG